MDEIQKKIIHSKELIQNAVHDYGEKIAVGCSWGKDSMVLLDLALQVNPNIPIFSVLTIYKPKETYDFVVEVCKNYGINPNVYMVADQIPTTLKENNINVILLPLDEYREKVNQCKQEQDTELYYADPDLCCQLLKVVPMQYAYADMNLEAWFSGLRNTEGHTRKFLDEIEIRSEKEVKINPILVWTEQDIWTYLQEHNVPIHPWYHKTFSDGRKIRSLGCEPCTHPVHDHEQERDGRWKKTHKKAGECGIHTSSLKE